GGRGGVPGGGGRRTQSWARALAGAADEHAARANRTPPARHVRSRSFREADRYLQAGITYCTDRDLDTWRLYMSAWLARSLAEQGHYTAADRCLADILRHPHRRPIPQVCALAVAGVLAARRGRDGTGPLDEALSIALRTGEYQRLMPVTIARAEVAWIAGRSADVIADIDRIWPLAIAHSQPWEQGELSWWLCLAGEHRQAPAAPASPFALMLAGEHRAAAGEWRELSCPLWSAYALAFSPRLRDAQECLEILDGLGVPALRHAVLRDRHARGLAVPRGPRATRRASPAGLT